MWMCITSATQFNLDSDVRGANGGSAFGGIYFGTPEEAEASKKMRLSYGQASKLEQISVSSLASKLDSIILPNVEFREATLREAVDYLRAISIKLDTATNDPNLKGVNFIAKLEVSAADPKITLNLKNVTLGQATKYVAELSGCKVSVQSSAVVFLAPADYEAAQKVGAAPVAQTFILPSVVFVGATLAEAIEFVRVKSNSLDPAKQGLNIVLKPGCDPAAKFSLSLKNSPASEVLRYCAELTKHKLSVEGNVFVIAP